MVARKTYFKLHNALGLALAVIVVVSASTGAVLTFRSQLGFEAPRAPEVETHLPLETILERAVAAGDGSPATDVGLPLEPTDPYHVWLDDDAETEVWLDGAGEVLATRAGGEGLTRTLFLLHTGELLGVVGQGVMLLAALGLMGLAWSGVGMWWSRRRKKR
ncbi:PepSY domain-containing protein [Pseudenhygromyxa sp. WMMC2535]|uniref:PepSY domain-containing protein n=1 Tax=Pseudenhygromyxa sp. WMMC2535 TaxID=2712867 RepID=UPI0015952014|nr:PepSY domain-containing protein [Pseudenhygromyxa sp. WMMC2535]